MTFPKADNSDLFVAVLLDRSGSMEEIRDDVIGGFNAFLAKIGGDAGTTLVTLTQFDSVSVDVLCDGMPAREVLPLTHDTFEPRGTTPLFDALGSTLALTEERVRRLGWTGSVMFVIITDGHENASTEWTRERVFARVKQMEESGWAFLYMGAHADAYDQASGIGVAPGNQARFGRTARGTERMAAQMAVSAFVHRTGTRAHTDLISEDERRRLEETDAGGYL